LIEGAKDIAPGQQPFVRRNEEVKGWKRTGGDEIGLLDVVKNAKVTVLAGLFRTAEYIHGSRSAGNGQAYGESRHFPLVESDISFRVSL
jgi:hypothetical protein